MIDISDDESDEAVAQGPNLKMTDVVTPSGTEWLNDAVVNFFGKAAVDADRMVFVESQFFHALETRKEMDKVSRQKPTRAYLKSKERTPKMYVSPARVEW